MSRDKNASHVLRVWVPNLSPTILLTMGSASRSSLQVDHWHKPMRDVWPTEVAPWLRVEVKDEFRKWNHNVHLRIAPAPRFWLGRRQPPKTVLLKIPVTDSPRHNLNTLNVVTIRWLEGNLIGPQKYGMSAKNQVVIDLPRSAASGPGSAARQIFWQNFE